MCCNWYELQFYFDEGLFSVYEIVKSLDKIWIFVDEYLIFVDRKQLFVYLPLNEDLQKHF